jgi:hypothetical protein
VAVACIRELPLPFGAPHPAVAVILRIELQGVLAREHHDHPSRGRSPAARLDTLRLACRESRPAAAGRHGALADLHVSLTDQSGHVESQFEDGYWPFAPA